MPRRIVRPAAVGLLAVGAGCAVGGAGGAGGAGWVGGDGGVVGVVGALPEQDPPGAHPDDFSVDLMVRPPGDDKTKPHKGRYVLFPDGSFVWGDDPGWLGTSRRMLSRRQVVAVWSLIGELGFDNPDVASAMLNIGLLEPGPGQTIYAAVISGRGRRWTHVRRVNAGEKLDGSMGRLVGELVGLARRLGPMEASDALRQVPRRYEFGPDPYARYRRPR